MPPSQVFCLFLILWFCEIQKLRSYYLRLSGKRYISYIQFSFWESTSVFVKCSPNHKMFYCNHYITNSEGKKQKLKTELFHLQPQTFAMKSKSHTTIIYARLHSSQCNSHRRLAGILYYPCFQELGLSLFFLSQHFWEPSLQLSHMS